MDWLQAEPVLVCSQTSIGLSGCFAASSASGSASSFQAASSSGVAAYGFFECGDWIDPADRLERLPAALGRQLVKPKFGRHEIRDFAARPHPAIRRRLPQPHLELVQQIALEVGGAGPVVTVQL